MECTVTLVSAESGEKSQHLFPSGEHNGITARELNTMQDLSIWNCINLVAVPLLCSLTVVIVYHSSSLSCL